MSAVSVPSVPSAPSAPSAPSVQLLNPCINILTQLETLHQAKSKAMKDLDDYMFESRGYSHDRFYNSSIIAEARKNQYHYRIEQLTTDLQVQAKLAAKICPKY